MFFRLGLTHIVGGTPRHFLNHHKKKKPHPKSIQCFFKLLYFFYFYFSLLLNVSINRHCPHKRRACCSWIWNFVFAIQSECWFVYFNAGSRCSSHLFFNVVFNCSSCSHRSNCRILPSLFLSQKRRKPLLSFVFIFFLRFRNFSRCLVRV